MGSFKWVIIGIAVLFVIVLALAFFWYRGVTVNSGYDFLLLTIPSIGTVGALVTLILMYLDVQKRYRPCLYLERINHSPAYRTEAGENESFYLLVIANTSPYPAIIIGTELKPVSKGHIPVRFHNPIVGQMVKYDERVSAVVVVNYTNIQEVSFHFRIQFQWEGCKDHTRWIKCLIKKNAAGGEISY